MRAIRLVIGIYSLYSIFVKRKQYSKILFLFHLTKMSLVVVLTTEGARKIMPKQTAPNSDKTRDYNVVFVYTRAAGAYEGVRTWTSFKSKEDFDSWYTDDLKKREGVVAEGVTAKRAIELCDETPRACTIAAAMTEATDPDGQLNQEILEFQLATAALAGRI